MSGSKKIVYIVSAVATVLIIVLGVVYLTNKNSPTKSGATGNSTNSTGMSGTPATTTAYTLATPKKIQKMKLSTSGVTYEMQGAKLSTAAKNFEKDGYGTPTKMIMGVYYLPGSSSFMEATAFRGFYFIGFTGKFNVSSIIRGEEKNLTDVTVEPASSHGGQMICGIGKSSGTASGSVCIWATASTFVINQYETGGPSLAKYSNMYLTTVKIRNAIEVPAK
jgi:hypothetical protein